MYIRDPASSARHLSDGRLARAAEVELGLDGLEQPMPFGLRHSQQDADHLHRQLGGDVDQKIEARPRHHRIEQTARAGAQIVLDAADHPRRQTRS